MSIQPVPREFRWHQAEQVWHQAAHLAPGCPMVAVSSADGGVGRSTVVAALGGLLALACPAPIVAVDVTACPWGGLGERVSRRSPTSVWDAVAAGEDLDGPLVEQLAQRGPTGLRALVGEVETGTSRRPPLVLEVAAAVRRLRRWYPLVLLDLPAAVTLGIWQALSCAAAPVFVARATPDSLRHTLRLLHAMRTLGLERMVAAAVIIVSATSPVVSRRLRAVEHQAAGVVGTVVRLPYDPALAHADPIDPRLLRRATRGALLEMAAAVLARCPTRPPPAPWLQQPQPTPGGPA